MSPVCALERQLFTMTAQGVTPLAPPDRVGFPDEAATALLRAVAGASHRFAQVG